MELATEDPMTLALLGAFGLMYTAGCFLRAYLSEYPASLGEHFLNFFSLMGAILCSLALAVVLVWLVYLAGWRGALWGVWTCFLTFFPTFVANISPGFAEDLNLPGAHVPISLKRLGSSKTWGSYYALAGALVAVLIQVLNPLLRSPLVDYHNPLLLAGIVLAWGFGSAWGDQIKSYLKRRHAMPEGSSWWPWDQDDCVLGSGLLLLFVIGSPVVNVWLGYLLLMPLVIHPIGNTVRYKQGRRSRIA